MRLKESLVLFLVFLLWIPVSARAQSWSGILNPSRAIDWSTAGIPGGIPNRTTICSTLTSSATSAQINSALAACPNGQVVYLSAGTYTLSSAIQMPSNVTLRGAGADQTILNSTVTSGPDVLMGTGSPKFSGAVSITGGNTAGSTSITVSSATGISAGGYLLIDQQNDGTVVSIAGSEGNCTWCDQSQSSTSLYAQGQIAEVTSVNGTTIGISPGLFVSYTLSPVAIPFTASAKYAGVESLQIYANNTHTAGDYSNFQMNQCAYCWISGVENNFTDGDHVEISWGYHDQIQNSYFSNAFIHTSGAYDSSIAIYGKTTGTLVQNNILERNHASIMLEWGAAGNVIAYNYMFGNYDWNAQWFTSVGISMHGAHPQFDLFEGNIDIALGFDSVWGSAANITLFRNFVVETGKSCVPNTQPQTRATVVCTPMGYPGEIPAPNGWWTPEGVVGLNDSTLSTYFNSVGNIYGSTTAAALYKYDQASQGLLPFTTMVNAVCGPSPCGTNSRDPGAHGYNYTIGYGSSSDTGGSSFDSINAYKTLLIHGDYASVSNSVTWASGITHSLPASFYLSSEPSWFGAVPWPAIGPDVSNGSRSDSYGYANKIPAQVCYEQVMGGTDGTGSPLVFNASRCYGQQTPAPPTNLTATPQ